MIDLLNTLTVDQILLYLVMFALAAKEVINFISWAKEKYSLKFNKDYDRKKELEKFERFCEKLQEQNENTQQMCEKLEEKIDDLSDTVSSRIDDVENKINKITTSNMHDIKSWIVDKHHTLIKQSSIDDFTMDTLEKRYSDYVSLGGNSYIGGLMAELRKLAHGSTEEKKE